MLHFIFHHFFAQMTKFRCRTCVIELYMRTGYESYNTTTHTSPPCVFYIMRTHSSRTHIYNSHKTLVCVLYMRAGMLCSDIIKTLTGFDMIAYNRSNIT